MHTEVRTGFSTPEPDYVSSSAMVKLGDPRPIKELAYPEKSRMRAAAYRAKRLFPGAAGEVLEREIIAWADFGYRLGTDKPMMRLIDEIMNSELPA